ncbi:DUF6328 family protein [Arthrobacter sp. SO3]|uniref:DUF6328 family protein n=1 Tax=Arthrobacter sp. SO3 TaxID=1897057 RepID=UPI001CFF5B65|nr:DUF6328 family protein [Arthrobacter sp. SO3]
MQSQCPPPGAPPEQRNESAVETLDRNWMELLQELRVLQPGVQILAGFLLTLPFQSRFETLDGFQTTLYLANVARAALVSSADRIAKVALAGIGLLSVGTSALVSDAAAGRRAGLTAGAVLLTVLLILLVYVPSRLRRQATERK